MSPNVENGFQIAIIGAPNVGKSSLLNSIVKDKKSIVTPTPHTTRTDLIASCLYGNIKIQCIDTPGFAKEDNKMHEEFSSIINKASDQSTHVLLIVDVTRPNAQGTHDLINFLQNTHANKYHIVLSKIDMAPKGKLYKIIQDIKPEGYMNGIFVTSAKTGQGIDILIQELSDKYSKNILPADTSYVEPSREDYVAECVREKAFHLLKQEIPFFIKTKTVRMYFQKKYWKAVVKVMTANKVYKKIVIGKGGSMVKNIGMCARAEMVARWGIGSLFIQVEANPAVF